MLSPLVRLRRGLRRRWAHTRGNARTDRIAGEVARAASLVIPAGERPVVFFNASTRLLGMSLNAAFQQAAAWAVQLAGVPAVQFVCQGGLSRCVLGTDRDRPEALPPCPGCIAQSRAQYALVHP
jgi:hypothetical protein